MKTRDLVRLEQMTDGISKLSNARREIDRIDDQVHDLLMERAQLVGEVIAGKTAGGDRRQIGLRPAREAQVIRRLLTRHTGDLPAEVIVRIWRELISAFTRMQGPLSIAICGNSGSGEYADLARFYFGSATPITQYDSEAQVLGAMAKAPWMIGIVPTVDNDDAVRSWWTTLAKSEDAPRIVSRLPFLQNGTGKPQGAQAYVLGVCLLEDSGDDVSLLVVSTASGLSIGGLTAAMDRAGLATTVLGNIPHDADDGRDILCQVDGPVAGDNDPRLAQVIEAAGSRITSLNMIGMHARPFELEEK